MQRFPVNFQHLVRAVPGVNPWFNLVIVGERQGGIAALEYSQISLAGNLRHEDLPKHRLMSDSNTCQRAELQKPVTALMNVVITFLTAAHPGSLLN